ncbi:MAG: hypothetical protein LAT83_23090, partial [Kiritimatiellae bacterium]|nr:hypothetical protein [Kiritimatiellia bacterium]
TVRNQTRVMETYLAPEASRDITEPPRTVRSLDRYGILQIQTPSTHTLVNRLTAPWYLERLRSEVEWNLAFLAMVAEDKAKTKEHMDLALAHDPVLRRQVDGDYFNAYSRVLDRLEKGRPLVGEAEEMRGLREREKLLMQWADMQFMLENFEVAKDLYERIQRVASRADNGNAVTRAAAGESLLLRAMDDPQRRETIPALIDLAVRYPRAHSSPHLLYRAALLSHGDPLPSSEIFPMVYGQYPNSPYAIRARYDEILRTIPWSHEAHRRESIDRFIRDYPNRNDYHEILERHHRRLIEIVSRQEETRM